MTTNDQPSNTSSTEEQGEYAVVQVPAHLLDQVLDYIKELTGGEEEVTGLVMTMIGGNYPGKSKIPPTGTPPYNPGIPDTRTRADQPTDIR